MNNAQLNGMRMMAETTPINYRVTAWGSKIGFDVVAGNTRFEAWENGAVVRTAKNDKAICGYENVEFYETGRKIKTAAEATIAVNEAIRAKKWQKCG